MNRFYNIYEDNGIATLDIFGEIGGDFWGEGNSFKNFVAEIEGYDDKELVINLDSPGGSCFDGNAIANAIKKRKKKTTCNIYSLCASIATTIASACDEVNAYANSLYMIHLASAGCWGNKIEMKKTIDLLDKMDNIIAETYASKTGKSKDEMLKAMEEETWYNANEAKEMGFIDNILESKSMVAKANIGIDSFKNYRNTPRELIESIEKSIKEQQKNIADKKLLEIENKRKKLEIELALL